MRVRRSPRRPVVEPSNVNLMLNHRLRRWFNIESTLVQRLFTAWWDAFLSAGKGVKDAWIAFNLLKSRQRRVKFNKRYLQSVSRRLL